MPQVRQQRVFILFAENSGSGHKTLITKYVFVYKSMVVTSPGSRTVVLVNVEVVVDRKRVRAVTENSNVDRMLTLAEITEIKAVRSKRDNAVALSVNINGNE